MREITREQAEEIFQLTRVLEKKIEQTTSELKLSFSLSDKHLLHIIYDVKDHRQKFFVEKLTVLKAK